MFSCMRRKPRPSLAGGCLDLQRCARSRPGVLFVSDMPLQGSRTPARKPRRKAITWVRQ